AVLRRSSAGGAVETIGDAAVWANWLARTPF
ncbi:MAG: hypothetical protein QOC75_3187, partial [Pseudonocardiales bacterium]|nr:hypothetical protein [Pseudonocardiales bacterium]